MSYRPLSFEHRFEQHRCERHHVERRLGCTPEARRKPAVAMLDEAMLDEALLDDGSLDRGARS